MSIQHRVVQHVYIIQHNTHIHTHTHKHTYTLTITITYNTNTGASTSVSILLRNIRTFVCVCVCLDNFFLNNIKTFDSCLWVVDWTYVCGWLIRLMSVVG